MCYYPTFFTIAFLTFSNFSKPATNSLLFTFSRLFRVNYAEHFFYIIVMINIKAVVYLILGTLANKLLIQLLYLVLKVMMNSN